VGGGLLGGDVLAAVGDEGALVEAGARRQANEGDDDLAPARVRRADDGDLGDVGVFEEDVFDLGRGTGSRRRG